MYCKNPYVVQGMAFGCGQCHPCRYNQRRVWSHRITLEAAQYKDNAFLTLTYDEKHLPEDGSLNPRHMQLFLKRLRKEWEPEKIRFFGVGEYGDETQRPHYHLALFGFPTCGRGLTRPNRSGSCCVICDRVRGVWGKGNIYLGNLEPASASYIAGYVTKKLTRKVTDYEREQLGDRLPEFARMSLRPGIGCGMMDEVASVLLGLDYDRPDVPSALRAGKQKLPLGRYLRKQLRLRMGRDGKAPPETIAEIKEKLQPLLEVAYSYAPPGFRTFTFKQEVIEAGHQRRLQLAQKTRKTRKGNL